MMPEVVMWETSGCGVFPWSSNSLYPIYRDWKTWTPRWCSVHSVKWTIHVLLAYVSTPKLYFPSSEPCLNHKDSTVMRSPWDWTTSTISRVACLELLKFENLDVLLLWKHLCPPLNFSFVVVCSFQESTWIQLEFWPVEDPLRKHGPCHLYIEPSWTASLNTLSSFKHRFLPSLPSCVHFLQVMMTELYDVSNSTGGGASAQERIQDSSAFFFLCQQVRPGVVSIFARPTKHRIQIRGTLRVVQCSFG